MRKLLNRFRKSVGLLPTGYRLFWEDEYRYWVLCKRGGAFGLRSLFEYSFDGLDLVPKAWEHYEKNNQL